MKPTLRVLENRIRKIPGKVWFTLFPFKNRWILNDNARLHRRPFPLPADWERIKKEYAADQEREKNAIDFPAWHVESYA